jgi:hypothetical protein
VTALVAILRTLVVSHPLVLCVVSYGLIVWTWRRGVVGYPAVLSWRVTGVTFLVVYAAIVLWYTAVPQYADHAEPSIAALSWVVATGGSPYHATNGAQYAFPYGPLLYFANAGALLAFGPGLVSSKCAGVLAVLASLGLIGWACRQRGSSAASAVVMSTLGYLAFGYSSFWVRPEPLLLLAVAGAIAGLHQSSWLAASLVGLSLGLGVATKITALVYLVPVLVLLWCRHGPMRVLLAVGVSVAGFALLFVLSAQVSLQDYAFWTRSAARHGIRWRSLPSAMEWAVVISLSCLATLWGARHDRTVAGRADFAGRTALVACALGTFFLAAKQGTGPHHFLPFVPTLAYLEAETFRACFMSAFRGDRLRMALGMSAVILAALQQVYWIPAVARSADRSAITELRRLEGGYTGPIAVGYSSAYRQSYLRPLPVFAGQPYQIDAVALMDVEVSGDSFPQAIVDSIRRCDVNVWLIPSAGEPFGLTSAYHPGVPVFGPDFIRAFYDRYRLVERGKYFDAWVCRR